MKMYCVLVGMVKSSRALGNTISEERGVEICGLRQIPMLVNYLFFPFFLFYHRSLYFVKYLI